MERKIVIIGAGPTGIGAAYRLNELGYRNWEVYEQEDHVGGLASSFVDEKGFVWDIGGHVMFSHYEYFDRYVDSVLGEDFLTHQRKSFIRMLGRWVPYPFQNNIRYLPKQIMFDCLIGLFEASLDHRPARNFEEWIKAVFGEGIARHFMLPYNQKVWAFPLCQMSKDWIAERVSVVDFKRVLANVIFERDDVGWGPNSTFRFPLFGGTGAMFARYVPSIKDHLFLKHRLVAVNTQKRTLFFDNGKRTTYDLLLSSIPLDELAKMIDPVPEQVLDAAGQLAYIGGVMVGLGFEKKCPSDKCWMYFPESNSPFYRVTYFSNYSPNNVPTSNHYSLICETSCQPEQTVHADQETIAGLIASGLITRGDVESLVSTKVIRVKRTYPIPTLDRDHNLKLVHEFLERSGVLSRGRFGGWRYEIGNTDHSFMQGKEAVDRLVLGQPETVWTPL